MDGTLLNSNHEVSDRFFELFEELKERNIVFVAASGRQYNSIIDKLHSIKNDIIVIAENGGLVMHRANELLSTPLKRDMCDKVLETIEATADIHPVLCGKRNAFLTEKSGFSIEMLRQYYSKFEIVDDLYKIDTEILKIAIYHFECSEKHVYPVVKHLEDEFKVKVSGTNWVDVSSPNANKGFALQKVQELYSIDPKETMVFGDYNNDLEMLAMADFSFAMENAHLNVKKAAKYTTSSNDDFGVERVLERLVNI